MKKNYGSVIVFLVVAIFSISFMSCHYSHSGGGGGKSTLKYTNQTTRIEAGVGEEFIIVLKSNQTTGYSWRLSEELDRSILSLVGSVYLAPGTRRVGAGGKEVWKFKAIGQGQTTISFEYVRPWEKNLPPAEEQTFTVIVH